MNHKTNVKKHESLILAILLPPLALAIVLGLATLPLGKRIENVTLDSRFKWRTETDPPAHPRILLVGIAEQCLENFGRWPWPRNIHGQFMQLLTLRQPTSIAFDILFTEDSQNADEDLAFADGLALHTGSITGATTEDLGHLSEREVADAIPGAFVGKTPALTNITGDISLVTGQNHALMPVKPIAKNSMTGFVNVDPSPVDGVRRKAPLVIRAGKIGENAHLYPSLVLQALMRNENLGPDDVEVVLGKHVRVKGTKESWEIPIDETGQM